MKNSIRILSLLCLPFAAACSFDDDADAPMSGAQEPVVWAGAWELWGGEPGDIEWSNLSDPKGGKEAKLFSDPGSGESVSLMNWPIKAQVSKTATEDIHIVNISGTLALTVHGKSHNVGPSGYVMIPKGVAYEIKCANAGNCVFAMHRSGRNGEAAMR